MDVTTIKTLATALNVAVSTVSKALRDSHEISTETKQKILALAKELNYTPNPYASSLRKRKSKTIGVVIPEVVNSFFSQTINGIESIAKGKGYHVLIYFTHENFENEKEILRDFKSGRVDGVLISVSRETNNCKHISALINEGVPVVFFDRVFEEANTTCVATNDFESACQATRHLIKSGCKKPTLVSIISNLNIITQRIAGFKQALEEAGLPFNTNSIIQCSATPEYSLALLKKALTGAKKTDGILSCMENLSIMIYQVCAELKINIPVQLQIISFSNLETASLLNPPLTTITQPAYEIGQTAAAILFKTLEKKNYVLASETIIIPSVLTLRKSTLEVKR